MKTGRTLYLIRHGHIGQEDGPRRYTGTTDTPLSQTGIRQAQVLSGWLEDKPLDGVYCSYLSRSVETARFIASAQGQDPVAVSDLHEINMGSWENLTFQEVQERYPKDFERRGLDIAGFKPPGGESFAECQQRAWAALIRILGKTQGDVAVVAHAGVNRALLCRMLGMDLNDLFCLRQDYGCINGIGYGEIAPVLNLFNFVPVQKP